MDESLSKRIAITSIVVTNPEACWSSENEEVSLDSWARILICTWYAMTIMHRFSVGATIATRGMEPTYMADILIRTPMNAPAPISELETPPASEPDGRWSVTTVQHAVPNVVRALTAQALELPSVEEMVTWFSKSNMTAVVEAYSRLTSDQRHQFVDHLTDAIRTVMKTEVAATGKADMQTMTASRNAQFAMITAILSSDQMTDLLARLRADGMLKELCVLWRHAHNNDGMLVEVQVSDRIKNLLTSLNSDKDFITLYVLWRMRHTEEVHWVDWKKNPNGHPLNIKKENWQAYVSVLRILSLLDFDAYPIWKREFDYWTDNLQYAPLSGWEHDSICAAISIAARSINSRTQLTEQLWNALGDQ